MTFQGKLGYFIELIIEWQVQQTALIHCNRLVMNVLEIRHVFLPHFVLLRKSHCGPVNCILMSTFVAMSYSGSCVRIQEDLNNVSPGK
jgi:hypothetical protein